MLAPWIDRGAFRPISAEASAGDGGVRVDQSDRVFRAVEYVAPRQAGAICPGCGAFCGVSKTMPDEGDGVRIRYHRCDACGAKFSSVEVASRGDA